MNTKPISIVRKSLHLDDMWMIFEQQIGDIAKDMYDNILFEGSTCSYNRDTFGIFIFVLLTTHL